MPSQPAGSRHAAAIPSLSARAVATVLVLLALVIALGVSVGGAGSPFGARAAAAEPTPQVSASATSDAPDAGDAGASASGPAADAADDGGVSASPSTDAGTDTTPADVARATAATAGFEASPDTDATARDDAGASGTVTLAVDDLVAEGTAAQAAGDAGAGASTADAQEGPAIGFVYVDRTELDASETQTVAVVFQDEALAPSAATLTYASSDGTTYRVDATAIAGNAALFAFTPGWADTFSLVDVNVLIDGVTYATSLVSPTTGPCTFSVTGDALATSLPSLALFAVSASAGAGTGDDAASDADTTFYAIDGSDDVASAATLAASLAASGSTFTLGDDGVLTVALDPGHGGEDSGAVGVNGLLEKDANWQIALYCKAALEQVPGVRVVLTRGEDECPGLDERAARAAAADADLYVSIHNNSADAESAHGFEIYYPNDVSTWRRDQTSVPGEQLAEAIEEKLAALGLYDRGIKQRLYVPDPGETDSYGNLYSYEEFGDQTGTTDYYALIRYPRRYGIPAVIVEHAFVTNESDAGILSNDWWLQQLGQADADAILACYADALDATGEGAEVNVNGSWYYRNANGSYLTSSFKQLPDGVGGTKTVWYGADGKMTMGEANINGSWYLFDETDGSMKTGFQTIPETRADGSTVMKTVYYDDSGRMVMGEAHINGSWYHFDETDGAMSVGITDIGYKTVGYGSDGRMLFGTAVVDGDTFSFDPYDGTMQTGFRTVSGSTGTSVAYYRETPGMGTDGAWHEAGSLAKGEVLIDGDWFDFDETTGAMRVGFTSVPTSEGGAKTVYYRTATEIDASGATHRAGSMVFGERNINGAWYHFDETDGSMSVGITDIGYKTVGYGSDGRMLFGKGTINGATYYFDPYVGTMQTGFVITSDGCYYADPTTGRLTSGERLIDGSWFYFRPDTFAAATGFVRLADTSAAHGSKIVYYDLGGRMLFGTQLIGGATYVFDATNGALVGGSTPAASAVFDATPDLQWDPSTPSIGM